MADFEGARSRCKRTSVYLECLFVAIAVGVPLTPIALAASPIGGLGEIILAIPILIVWATTGIASLSWCVHAAVTRAWRRSLTTSILPIVLLLVALNASAFYDTCNYLGETARFAALKPSYDRQIAALPASGRPGLAVFMWDGFLGASNGVLYDETDQVMLPRGRKSADWLARASHTELMAATQDRPGSCDYSVRPLWDHYYRAALWC